MNNINLQSELRQHLDPYENLLWTGQPKKGIIFRSADIFLIPFSLLWCGFAIFWMVMVSQTDTLFALFGIPFVVIGLFFVFGRFIVDAQQRANTLYGLTEKRVIIKSGIFSKKIKSIDIQSLTNLEVEESADGSGVIFLAPKNQHTQLGNSMGWWPGLQETPQLKSIPNARKVYNQIAELKK